MKKLKQAEAEKQQLQRSLQEQSKLMKQLCESSDSEMPKKNDMIATAPYIKQSRNGFRNNIPFISLANACLGS